MSDTDSPRGVTFKYELSDDERMLLVRGLLRLAQLPRDERIPALLDKLLDDGQAAS